MVQPEVPLDFRRKKRRPHVSRLLSWLRQTQRILAQGGREVARSRLGRGAPTALLQSRVLTGSAQTGWLWLV